MPKDDQPLLAEKRTHLAEKRTEMAHERTILAYLRTAATVILFGVAFLGAAQDWGVFFTYAGWTSIMVGIFILIIVFFRTLKHSRELRVIKEFFAKHIRFKLKK
jgi:uncharacterized membrane protein YidH (DUF202 family)